MNIPEILGFLKNKLGEGEAAAAHRLMADCYPQLNDGGGEIPESLRGGMVMRLAGLYRSRRVAFSEDDLAEFMATDPDSHSEVSEHLT